ncbi:MAG: nucleotidyltransferase family protein [bacterium]
MRTIYSSYIEAWKRKQAEEERELKTLKEEAFALAKKVCSLLVKKYGATKVVLFGSAVKGRWSRDSDIDLGVEGIGKEVFIKVLVETEELIGRSVDIKPLEECKGFFKERIEKEGVVLYEDQRRNHYSNC